MRQSFSVYSKFNQFMTKINVYTFPMERLLITSAGAGIVWAIVLFLVCFFSIHIAKLANLGRQAQKRLEQSAPPKQDPPAEKKAPAPSAQEPIYYIVEKKRRAKQTFSEPKEIKFK